MLACAVLLLLAAPTAWAAPPNFWGLHHNGSFTTNPNDWEAIDRSGAEIYRLEANWKQVASAGDWRQSSAWEQTYDKYFELATKANVSILPYLYGRKTAADEHRFYLSNEWQEWLEFVWTFVQRYGRGGTFWDTHPNLSYRPVLVWEVWNEPNLPLNNPGGSQVLPQKYAEFLIATSNTIHQAQNTIRNPGEPSDTGVLHGGLLQPNGEVREFLEKASKISGYASSFFGLSIHPYSHFGTEAEKRVGVMANLNAARQALDAVGSTGKSLWITELGWSVYYSSEAEQANLLRWSFDWLEENAAPYKLQLVTWYFYRDINVNHWAYHTGLRREDGSYRPAWYEYLTQTGAPAWPAPEARWFLRNSNTAGGGDMEFIYGAPKIPPVPGDWNKDGVDTPGIYNPANCMWHLRNSNTAGNGDINFCYGGGSGTLPVVGDWNSDGIDTVGIYNPANCMWHLRNSNTAGNGDINFCYGGGSGTLAVTGDWNGDGIDTPGIYVPITGQWHLRNSNTAGSGNINFIYGGGVGTKPVTGDWNNDGIDTVGIYNPANPNHS